MAATKAPRKRTADEGRTSAEYLREALDELGEARDRASEDVRASIDAAMERTRRAMKEAGSGAAGQVADWRRSLDKATDDARRELGILAVRAQRSPESLRAMSAEIRKRKAEITQSR